jgi:hypothetical protein
MSTVENEKKILLLDFLVVKMMENKSGFICKSDKFDLFILPISSNCANLSVNCYYRIVRPNIESFINNKIISIEDNKRVQPLKHVKIKINRAKPTDLTKFETTYGNNLPVLASSNKPNQNFIELIKKESLPMYVKLTKSVDTKKGNYKICDIKDVTGAKQTIILNDTQIANMVIGNVYYIKEIKFNSVKKRLFISSSASIMLATSDISKEFINIPCGDFSCNKILEWDTLTEYNSCPVDKKKLTDEFVCPKCSNKFEKDDKNIKDWLVHLVVMNPTEDDTRTILLFKKNFNISLENYIVSEQLDSLIDVEICLEYSSQYNCPEKFVIDKLSLV